MLPKALTLLAVLALTLSAMPAAAAAERQGPDARPDARSGSGPDAAPVDLREWRSDRDFRKGEAEGLRRGPGGGLVIGRPAGTIEHTEPDLGTTRTYEYGHWTSPSYRHGFGATQLVASWNAETPDDTWLRVEMQGRTDSGATTAWFTMGRWALGDGDVIRTSVPDQEDANGYISVDTFVANSGVTLRSYQLRVTLYREAGKRVTPRLAMVGAMTSAIPDRFTVPPSPPAGAWGRELPVPPYSQNIHIGEYPEYGGGGEAWCSPTSTEMVVEYWGRGPKADDLAWVDPSYADPSVDHAARFTYDKDYDGTGNWPFNTAYAASFGLAAHVTRLESLAELERYIVAGIPVITSQSFLASELDGAGYGTAGHLMVIIGFTEEGDVIANDPASASNSEVRNVYKREQFENIWLRTKRYNEDGGISSGSGGIAYVIAPVGKKLPN